MEGRKLDQADQERLAGFLVNACSKAASYLGYSAARTEVIELWQLTTIKAMSHIIVTPGTSTDLSDRFIKDVADDRRA